MKWWNTVGGWRKRLAGDWRGEQWACMRTAVLFIRSLRRSSQFFWRKRIQPEAEEKERTHISNIEMHHVLNSYPYRNTANWVNSGSVCNAHPSHRASQQTLFLHHSRFQKIFALKRQVDFSISPWKRSSSSALQPATKSGPTSHNNVPRLCVCVSLLCRLFASDPGLIGWGFTKGSLPKPPYLHLPGEIAFLLLWNSLATGGNEMGLASPCC